MSGSPLSTNMFAYCENDSINYADYDGFRITVNVKRTNNSYVLKVKLPWSDISNYFNYLGIAYGMVGLVACFIPEPVVSKRLRSGIILYHIMPQSSKNAVTISNLGNLQH